MSVSHVPVTAVNAPLPCAVDAERQRRELALQVMQRGAREAADWRRSVEMQRGSHAPHVWRGILLRAERAELVARAAVKDAEIALDDLVGDADHLDWLAGFDAKWGPPEDANENDYRTLADVFGMPRADFTVYEGCGE